MASVVIGGYEIHYEPGDHVMEFKAYEVVEATDAKGAKSILYAGKEDDYVNTLDEAQIYLSGSVKWDGCSNLNFDAQESCMLHFCSLAGVQEMAAMIAKVYEIAKENIKRWDA